MKLNRTHSPNPKQFQARLHLQRDLRRREVERVDKLLVASTDKGDELFKSDLPERTFQNMDELVLAGNQHFEELDNVDFAGFRNDRDLAARVLEETRAEVSKFHPDAKGLAFNADVRRVVQARYLQGHGIQVQASLDGDSLATLRKYLQRQETTTNVADAVRAINSRLEEGEKDPEVLMLQAERALFLERGVEEQVFEQRYVPHLDLLGLGLIRDFADSWAVSQSGKFLSLAEGKNASEMRDSITENLLAVHGIESRGKLETATALSLLRDQAAEGPRTNATLTEAIKEAVESGEDKYFRLNVKSNQKLLKELGVSDRQLRSMNVSDQELLEAYPDLEADEARAARTRVLRDLLRVLPRDERKLALSHLRETEVDLIGAEQALSKHLGERIRTFSGYSTGYGKMGAMQRANLASALSRLPDEVLSKAFDGKKRETLDRLEAHIESTFDVKVHRESGRPPNQDPSYEPHVKDWTVQGMLDLFNALSSMNKDGQLPPGLAGTTTLSFMEGAPSGPSMMPVDLRGPAFNTAPWDRPGESAFPKGQSGFFGECTQDEDGNDQVVIYDDALLGANGDSPEGVTMGESTIIHELGHAIQLGGTPGSPAEERSKDDQLRMAEWSSLSRWTEPDSLLADGKIGDYFYYYDPGVKVEKREEIATTYGASDPCEDFAEYTPFFFKDPETAMGLSLEKFHYFNQLVGGYYDAEQVRDIGKNLGFDELTLRRADLSMQKKIAKAPTEAGLLTA